MFVSTSKQKHEDESFSKRLDYKSYFIDHKHVSVYNTTVRTGAVVVFTVPRMHNGCTNILLPVKSTPNQHLLIINQTRWRQQVVKTMEYYLFLVFFSHLGRSVRILNRRSVDSLSRIHTKPILYSVHPSRPKTVHNDDVEKQ